MNTPQTIFFQECTVAGSPVEVCKFMNFRREMIAAGYDADAVEIMPMPTWAELGASYPGATTASTVSPAADGSAHMGAVALFAVALGAGAYTLRQQFKKRQAEIEAIAAELEPRVTEPSPWEPGALAERGDRGSIEVPFDAHSTYIRPSFEVDSTPIRDLDRGSIDVQSTPSDWFTADGEPNYESDPAVELLHRRWEAMLQEGATFDPSLGQIEEPVEVNEDYQLLKYLVISHQVEPRSLEALKRVWGVDTVPGRSRGSKCYEMALTRRNLYAQTLDVRAANV